MPPSQPALLAHGLQRRYGAVAALREVTLTIERGEVILLVGPNGAGKTTLLRCLAGLVRPTRGTVRVAGVDVRIDPTARKGIGMLSHHAMVYDDLTPRENLRFAAALHELANAEQLITASLDAAGLAARADSVVRGFSRGMLQRLAIARATLHSPDVLLLDEPFTGLDAPAARTLRERIAAEHLAGRTIVCVSHDPSDIWDTATRIVVLVDGRVLHDAPRPDSLAQFRDDYARMIA